MNTQVKRIELLALQFGCNTIQIQQVTQATFRKLHSQITEVKNEQQLCLRMYQIAFDTMKKLEQSAEEETRLQFEEDQQLHNRINRLNGDEKIIFLLTYFHDMTENEVEFITILQFDSLEAVRAFAGENYELAVVPPKARALLSRFDEKSQHYEIKAEDKSD